MWSGFIFYFIFVLLIAFLLVFFVRLNFLYAGLIRLVSNNIIFKNIIIFILFFYFFALLNIYLLFEYYANCNLLDLHLPIDYFIVENYYNNYYNNYMFCSVDTLQLYYFPFIYIFLLITLLSILFCLSYTYNELYVFILYCSIILGGGYLVFFVDSLILFFFSYELLLMPSFFILYRFAKTRRCIEAAYLMFFWTQFGAFFLIFSFLYLFLITGSSSFTVIAQTNFSEFEINFLFICWIIGFGVKFPIWPFYGWLPKAHVEASTNFSIFLSGVLVKFAFFGFLKCLLSITNEPTFFYCFPFIVIGILDSVFKLFYQIDLKKLVAFATVVEMHWLVLCFISGQTALWLSGFCMLISHALMSTNSFMIVDAINRRFKTRLITEINGINFLCPKLFLVALTNLIIFLGFPGSIFFIAEFLFFSFCFDLFPIVAILLFVLLYFLLPTFFLRTWMNVMFGLSVNIYKKLPQDLDSREFILFCFMFFILFWFGFTWQSFIF